MGQIVENLNSFPGLCSRLNNDGAVLLYVRKSNKQGDRARLQRMTFPASPLNTRCVDGKRATGLSGLVEPGT